MTDNYLHPNNDAASQLFGASQQALTGKALSEMLAPGQAGEESALRTVLGDAMERTRG